MFQTRTPPSPRRGRAGKPPRRPRGGEKEGVHYRDAARKAVYAVHEVEGVAEGDDPEHPDREDQRPRAPRRRRRAPAAGRGAAGPRRRAVWAAALVLKWRLPRSSASPTAQIRAAATSSGHAPSRPQHRDAGQRPGEDGDPAEPRRRDLVRGAEVRHVEQAPADGEPHEQRHQRPRHQKRRPPAATARVH